MHWFYSMRYRIGKHEYVNDQGRIQDLKLGVAQANGLDNVKTGRGACINMHGDVITQIMGCEAMNTFEH